MEFFSLLLLGAALWLAYHLWYVPRGTKNRDGASPREPHDLDRK